MLGSILSPLILGEYYLGPGGLFSTLEDSCSCRPGFKSGAVVTIAAMIDSGTAARTTGSTNNLN